MHNAPRLDQRSVRATSNIIANGKCAVKRGMTPLTFYNSRSIILFIFIYFFCLPLSLLPCNPAILTHSARRDCSVDTDCVLRVTQQSWPEFLMLMERIKVDVGAAEHSVRIISEDEFSE